MCVPCKNKKAAAQARAVLFNKTRTISEIEFLNLYYVGPEDEEVPTLLNKVTYGKKPYGVQMFVARVDYEAHPELWQENEPSNSNIID